MATSQSERVRARTYNDMERRIGDNTLTRRHTHVRGASWLHRIGEPINGLFNLCAMAAAAAGAAASHTQHTRCGDKTNAPFLPCACRTVLIEPNPQPNKKICVTSCNLKRIGNGSRAFNSILREQFDAEQQQMVNSDRWFIYSAETIFNANCCTVEFIKIYFWYKIEWLIPEKWNGI